MTNRKVFDKHSPTKDEKFFIPLPSDALHYIHHDRISADKLFLYALIIDHYNPDHGYAFPSVERLSVMYGKAPDTTSRHLDDLKAAGLIDFPEKGMYVPLVPQKNEEFYKDNPQAWKNYQTTFKRYEKRKEAAAERMKLWRRENGYSD
ncbi:helix-turn-helix domain-containing protein [Fictibacillus enclensis]|uniref:helix-turn-helix domain-containing protein n=1 Tax=Fictibacillus enclensis TaxID=1017270 RepID=UPI0025A053DD|nr:helix-turn-helix domain-containing protein [Fictibacillus enclensis]MDM5339690.1 helix-turn-helix domain-containing protein [Fictibacillus enclensis]